MKSRYLILLSLILTIGLAGLSGLTTGCTGLLEDSGQITIDGPPAAAIENPNEQAEQKDAMYLSDLHCPVTEERDLAELLKQMPKDCGESVGESVGEIVLISDISSMFENEGIREFAIGMIERDLREEAMREIINERNSDRFSEGMSDAEMAEYFKTLSEEEKKNLQTQAGENVNALNDEMLSFLLSLTTSKTDFIMCATLDDEETKTTSISSGSGAPARSTAHGMGLGLRSLVKAKTAQADAVAPDPAEAEESVQYTTTSVQHDDDEDNPMIVILTDATNSSDEFAVLQDKLPLRDEFQNLDLDKETKRRVQEFNEKIKVSVPDSDCVLMNTDGEFICKKREPLDNGRTMFTLGYLNKLAQIDQMTESLYSNKKILELVNKSNAPHLRLVISVSDQSNSAGLVIGANADNKCADMSLMVNDKPITNLVMTLPTIDIAMILNNIPIDLSDDGDSKSNESNCAPETEEMLYNEEGTANEDEYPASLSHMPGGEEEEMPPASSYSNSSGGGDAEVPMNSLNAMPPEPEDVDE